MNKTENRKEIISLFIVFAIEMVVMVAISFGLSKLGINVPLIVRSIIIYIALLTPVIVYAKNKGGLDAKSFGIKKIKGKTILYTVLLTIVSAPMYMLANLISQFFVPNTIVQNSDNIMAGPLIFPFIAMAVLAPVCEEYICRGFFANRMNKLMPFWVAAVISGIMFGALHLNINQFSYAVVIGVVFAYANRASGSTITSMISHSIINGVSFVIVYAGRMVAANSGLNFADTLETARNNQSEMLSGLAFYGVLAVFSFILTRKIIRTIAKSEGNV